MTETRLRELLHDLAEDAPPAALRRVEAAWHTAHRPRPRRGLVVAAAVGVATVATSVVVVQAPWRDDPVRPPGVTTATPTPTGSPRPTESSGPPDSRYHGVPVWWAPAARDDATLPELETGIPPLIDLSPSQDVLRPGERALAVYQVAGADERLLRLVVLTVDGDTRELPAGRIEPNRDEAGNSARLLHLSPTGDFLAISQPGSLEVYDVASGDWTSIDTPDWVAEGARWIDDHTLWVPDSLEDDGSGSTYAPDGRPLESAVRPGNPSLAVSPGDTSYSGPVAGPEAALAGSYFLQGPVRGGPYTNPEGVIARSGDATSILAVGAAGRSKVCCPVVGWLDAETVGFTTNGRILAWRVGSDRVYRVAQTTGVDPRTEFVTADWAAQALR